MVPRASGRWPARPRTLYVGAIALLMLAGFIARGILLLGIDFPLNDGGLFLVMIETLGATRYGLPDVVAYNGVDIPFAYPPLAFYAARLAADLTGIMPLDLIRLLPLAMSTLSVLAFALLAQTMLHSKVATLVATAIFAVLPTGFIVLIMGGGLTRSFAYVFALLALREAYLLYTTGSRGALIRYVLWAGLTMVSHLEVAWYLAIGTFVCLLTFGRSRRAFLHSTVAVIGVLACSAPWWATVIARHGLEPLRAASQTGTSLATLDVNESGIGPLLFLALTFVAFGASVFLAATGDRRLAVLGWMGLTWLLDGRAIGWTITAPLALVLGASFALVPRRTRHPSNAGETVTIDVVPQLRPATRRLVSILPIAVAGFIFLLLVRASFASPLYTMVLSHGERNAMRSIAASMPPDARFVVITGDYWSADRTVEWFPVLAQRESVTTPQGYEWLPDRIFLHRIAAHFAAQSCVVSDGDCLLALDTPFDDVYVAKREEGECCDPLRSHLRADPRFRLVYDGPGASIFALRSPQG